jgi:hypothetical protein
MEQKQHYIQDACELYAVAELQRLAEDAGLAITRDAKEKLKAFNAYGAERNLTSADFDRWPEYMANVELHMPGFFSDLAKEFDNAPMDFVDVERVYRNLNMKGDFVIVRQGLQEVSVSLKNYQQSASRPQCSSGTFNSFPLNFIFESAGVGMFIDAAGNRFRGSSVLKRNAALVALGLSDVVPLMTKLDELNAEIKERFVYSQEFEFLNEDKFDKARKQVGAQGQEIILELLNILGEDAVKSRLLKMTSLDGSEEILIMDPSQRSDSITNATFKKLRNGVLNPYCKICFGSHGQSIRFEFVLDGAVLLTVDVPFTINKNGAWISEEYEGSRMHTKEGVSLRSGQRRPKKSKELATSTNTYVDFAAAGIFSSL